MFSSVACTSHYFGGNIGLRNKGSGYNRGVAAIEGVHGYNTGVAMPSH